jgi:hypothetical protein
VTRRGKSRLDCRAQIDADDFACAPARSQLRMATLAAAAFEHHLVLKKRGLDRRNPSQKLLFVLLVLLCEVLPLPAEVGGGRGLVRFNLAEFSKARDAAHNREMTSARGAIQIAFEDFRAFATRYRQQTNLAAASRTDQKL